MTKQPPTPPPPPPPAAFDNVQAPADAAAVAVGSEALIKYQRC